MKKLLTLLIVFLVTGAIAQDPQGIKADVELLSGTRQRAQFLGIQNDTVQLGGYIKNKFTIVRIVKSQFKSIVDEQGNDLLNPPKATESPSTVGDSSLVQDSIQTQDSIQVQADSVPEAVPPKVLELKSQSVMVTLAPIPADTALSMQIDAMIARILYENGNSIQLVRRDDIPDCDDDICIQNKLASLGAKEIYFGKVSAGTKADSLSLELSQALFEDDLPTIHKAVTNISSKAAISDLLQNNKLQNLLLQARGDSIPVENDPRSYIYVETDPEGATLSRPEENAICKTPCAFTVQDTGKIVLNAYWNVGEHLWGAQTTIHPYPGDTAKISLKLKPVHPEVQIITSPAGAEIFRGDEEITKHSKTLGRTPNKFSTHEPGMATLRLRQIGFRDTLVQFYIAPVSETKLNIQMEKLTDLDEIAQQQKWQDQRNKLTLGHVLMSCAAAPVIVGAIFTYLGHRDYDDAKEIKDDLQIPASVNGDKYQQMVEKNKNLVDSGDKKMIIGASLIGTGAVMFGLGLFFTF